MNSKHLNGNKKYSMNILSGLAKNQVVPRLFFSSSTVVLLYSRTYFRSRKNDLMRIELLNLFLKKPENVNR
jgi:hypothetical protein